MDPLPPMTRPLMATPLGKKICVTALRRRVLPEASME